MTYLEIVNEVLKRLREDTVTSVSDSSYSTLIGMFVKQAYQECSNAYQWPQLDETQDVAIVANDTSFTITTDSGEGIGQIYSIYNVTDEIYMSPMAYRELRDRLTDDTDTHQPRFYSYIGQTAASTSTFYFYPKSDASYTLRVSYSRKPDLSNTMDDSTFVKIPEMPVILRSWALAISERGEDGGALSNEVDMMFMNSLADSISLYESNNPCNNLSWVVV